MKHSRASPELSLGSHWESRNVEGGQEHPTTTIYCPCPGDLLKAEAKMSPASQENQSEADSPQSKGHTHLGVHLGDHSLEREMASAQGIWMRGKIN